MSVCRWADAISSDSGYSFGRIALLERGKKNYSNDTPDLSLPDVTETKSINGQVSRLNLKSPPIKCSFKGLLSEINSDTRESPASLKAQAAVGKQPYALSKRSDIRPSGVAGTSPTQHKKRKDISGDAAPAIASACSDAPSLPTPPAKQKCSGTCATKLKKSNFEGERQPDPDGGELDQLLALLREGNLSKLASLPTASIQRLVESLNRKGFLDDLDENQRILLLQQTVQMQQTLMQQMSRCETESSALDHASVTEGISARLKDVAVGKATREYQNYISKVSRCDRIFDDPQTPDPLERCSAAKFHSKYRSWRVALHKYDPE